MSPATATPPKLGKALARLKKLEAKHASEKAKADRLSRDHFSKFNRLRELHDERQRLIRLDPTLVDHRDAPTDKTNAIADVDKQVRGLGDLEELGQQAAHQKRIADRAYEDTRQFVTANLPALIEDLGEAAAAVADRTNSAVAAACDEADEYVAFTQRIAGLLAAARVDTRVAGLDHAAAFSRNFRNWQLPPPLPHTEVN